MKSFKPLESNAANGRLDAHGNNKKTTYHYNRISIKHFVSHFQRFEPQIVNPIQIFENTKHGENKINFFL